MKYIKTNTDTYQKIIDLKIDYKQFIRLFLNFLKSEVLPMSFNTDFYNDLQPAFDFLNGKINSEKLDEYYLIAYENIETHNEILEENIARLIFNCLYEPILMQSYTEHHQKSKFLGIKREEITIIDNIYILINSLEEIEKSLSEKLYNYLKKNIN